jgi:hypothetical protein
MKKICIAIVLLLPACNVSQQPTSLPAASSSVLMPNAAKTLKARSNGLVYVSSQFYSTVDIYSRKGQGQQPIGTITDGVSSPAGLAVDSSGNLYVANSGNNTVTVYPPGQTTPSVTYSNGVSGPQGVAVGSDGTVYIANTLVASGPGDVTEYSAGSTTPDLTITLANEYPFTLALDASNNLYVSWFDLSSYAIAIYKYPTEGSSNGSNLNLDLPPQSFPAFAIAFDDRGNLVVPWEYIYTGEPPDYFAIFPPGATEPKRKINFNALLSVVTGIAFVPSNPKFFYVSAENDHDWMKLTYPKLIPHDVVNVGGPTGLALSP